MSQEKIQEELFSLQDLNYRDFHARLIPSVEKEKIIGVRTPALRVFAKSLGEEEAEHFMRELPHKYYEENNLHAFLIEREKAFDICIQKAERFLPYVDNWATCDMMKPKVFANHTTQLLPVIDRWLKAEDTYTVRFALNLLMTYYLDDNFKTEYLDRVAAVCSEEYYIKMMVAWYFATALAKQYDAALPYLTEEKLPLWIHNKTIQKAVESRRITPEKKQFLKTLKKKNDREMDMEVHMSTRIGILGYGNLGRGVECAVRQNEDMELAAVFTRRNPETVSILTETAVVCPVDEMAAWKDKIDVIILCGGSATDLPEQTPACVKEFNVIDSFDTHARIPEHFAHVDAAAKESSHIAVISVGWDPGLFSLNRMYGNAILPEGRDYTFWGKGVSQGHSDAIRRIDGVKNAKQYTIPIESALEAVRSGSNPELTTRQKHTRECFVVLEEGADANRIEEEIKTMPNYFADYDTTVHFITEEELLANHSGIPHGGFVLRSGVTGWEKENKHLIEYSLKLDSNPEFTSSVLVAYARAAHRLAKEGQSGCKTVLDIPPAYLSPKSGDELRASLL